MYCCHSRNARLLKAARRFSRDTRGVATLEGIIVLAIFAGVFLACLLLGQWSTSLQQGQMGARLLAFDAGDVPLARLGRASRHPVQQLLTEDWVLLFNSQTANWINRVFNASNSRFEGSVTDTVHGRLPGQASLFDYSRATMKYRTHGWSAGTDPWMAPESTLEARMLSIAWYVGRYQVSPTLLDSTHGMGIPSAIPILETIYTRVGIR